MKSTLSNAVLARLHNNIIGICRTDPGITPVIYAHELKALLDTIASLEKDKADKKVLHHHSDIPAPDLKFINDVKHHYTP